MDKEKVDNGNILINEHVVIKILENDKIILNTNNNKRNDNEK